MTTPICLPLKTQCSTAMPRRFLLEMMGYCACRAGYVIPICMGFMSLSLRTLTLRGIPFIQVSPRCIRIWVSTFGGEEWRKIKLSMWLGVWVVRRWSTSIRCREIYFRDLIFQSGSGIVLPWISLLGSHRLWRNLTQCGLLWIDWPSLHISFRLCLISMRLFVSMVCRCTLSPIEAHSSHWVRHRSWVA